MVILFLSCVCNGVQLLQLLLKSSQDKRFVCEAAEKALVAMTTSFSPELLLPKLEPYLKHRNPRIRAKASTCFCRSVQRLVRILHLHLKLFDHLIFSVAVYHLIRKEFHGSIIYLVFPSPPRKKFNRFCIGSAHMFTKYLSIGC